MKFIAVKATNNSKGNRMKTNILLILPVVLMSSSSYLNAAFTFPIKVQNQYHRLRN